jgi:hypothetical protein
MNLLTSVVTVSLLFAGQHPTMPQGMSHEEHLKQMEKDKALKKRGTDAMGFDQEATTHHFKLTPKGGAIEVTVKNGTESTVPVLHWRTGQHPAGRIAWSRDRRKKGVGEASSESRLSRSACSCRTRTGSHLSSLV